MATAALIPVPQPHTALAPFLVRVTNYIRQSRAPSTLRGYRADWRDFSAFCEGQGLLALPASPETVCSYLAHCADSGQLKMGSIQRRVSAIAAAHMAANLDTPTCTTAVRLCLAGIRRALGTRQEGKAPALTSDVAAMLSHVPAGLLGLRDRALLLVGFAGALRRSELAALNVEDLSFGDDGVKILIRHSKTDQEGAGQVVGITRGSKLCPVQAIQAWFAAAGITTGPVFRSVNRHRQVSSTGITPQVVAMVVKRCAAATGLDVRQYSGHSLRSGLVTSAVLSHVDLPSIQRQTRHKSLDMLMKYARIANVFEGNVSGRVGL